MGKIVAFDEVKAEMAKYKAKNESLVFDYNDSKGNAEARSHIFGMRKIKTAITAVHKTAKADALAACQVIDKEKRELFAEVDEWIEVHAKPIREIDERIFAEAEAKIKAAEDDKRIAEEKRLADLAAKDAELTEREAKLKAAEDAQKAEQEKIRLDAERIEREKRIADEAIVKAKADAEAKIIAGKAAELKAKQVFGAAEKKRVEDDIHVAEIDNFVHAEINGIIKDTFRADILFSCIKEGKIDHLTINY